MADIHIDDFCRDTARILNQLYLLFPRPGAVYVEDISGLDETDDVGLHSNRHMSCLGAMMWLAEEGYLRFEAMIYQDGIDQAVLTGKAFTLLSQVSPLLYEALPDTLPASIAAERVTVIEQIRAALRSGESLKISAIVRYLLSAQPQAVISRAVENLIAPASAH